ncbi:MAG: MFS transporter [Candidatus Omnitrophica bacterium]|nr:MFS transporter [Candidatus Omnitrophota bacterium]
MTNEGSTRDKGFVALIVTQFLGALNDNAFRFVIAAIITDTLVAGESGTGYLSLSIAVFILPFLLFSTFAGYLADRYSKRDVIIVTKVLELIIMALGLWALVVGNIWVILLTVFVMGAQSALFGPSKYGIIPEMLPKEKLSYGNGIIQMWTYAAILIGQSLSGFIMMWTQPDYYRSAFIFMGIALLGVVTSVSVPRVAAANPQRSYHPHFLKEIVHNLRWIHQDRALFMSIVGLAYFGFLSGLFQPNVLLYARKVMEINHVLMGILIGSLTCGIGLGCWLAGRVSLDKVELGLVPLGAVGVSFFSVMLGFVHGSWWLALATMFLLGLSSGFYMIPLTTMIQTIGARDRLGQILATNSFLSFTGILIGSFVLYLLRDGFGLNAAQIFVVSGGLTVVAAVYIIRLLPYSFIRFLVWMLAHTVYRIRVVGREHVPQEGGGLIVGNHVSYVDAVLLVVTMQRPIRFMVYREIYEVKWLKPLLQVAKAIPISYDDGPKAMLASLAAATQAIRDGELVCIFPEGRLTRTGNMLRFNRGLERVVSDTECPIIPVHLDRIWGSIFSFERGKYFFKWPKLLPYPVTITFGEAMPTESSTYAVRNRVRELGAESFKYRFDRRLTLPENFWHEARRGPQRFCLADGMGRRMTFGEVLVAAIVLSRRLRGRLDGQERIGVLLPPSAGGVLANVALAILNKVPVNLNYTTSAQALASIQQQCDMRTVIASRKFLDKVNISLQGEMLDMEAFLKDVTWREKCNAIVRGFVWPSALSYRLVFGSRRQKSIEQLATIMFTSGSTGEPKGVMLTHANIMSNLEGLYQIFHVDKNDRLLGILPFFHSFGFTGTLWFPLITGAGAVYHHNPLDAKMVGKLVQEHRATILMATPTFLNTYTRRCTAEQFNSLRLVVVGAEKLKSQVAEAFEEKFGILPMEGYGCTELSPIVALNLPDYTGPGGTQKAQKRGKIGLPLPGIAVRIVHPESGEPLEINQDGLMLVKGPNVMQGYLKRDELTREVINDGWYSTGDIANMDEDGFLMITDRLSRFSKIGGEMVPHIKVEEFIHRAVNADGAMCVVTSVPDDRKGERLAVIYQGDYNPGDIVSLLKESGLPNLWIPDASMFHRVEALPLLGTGKIDLGTVKKLAAGQMEGAGG